MYNDMMMDGPNGPDLRGEWINKRTGQKIFVRDSLIGESGMCIMLRDGSMMDMDEFSRDYVQMSDEEYDMNGNLMKPTPKPTVTGREKIPTQSTTNGMPRKPQHKKDDRPAPKPTVEEPIEPDMTFDNLGHPQMMPHMPQHHKPGLKPEHHPEVDNCTCKNQSSKLIEQVFNKIKPTIEIGLNLQSADFPADELKMLVNVLDVNIIEIGKYIREKYLDNKTIDTIISDYLKGELGLAELIVPDDPGDKVPDDGPTDSDNDSKVYVDWNGNPIVPIENKEGHIHFLDEEGHEWHLEFQEVDGTHSYTWDEEDVGLHFILVDDATGEIMENLVL